MRNFILLFVIIFCSCSKNSLDRSLQLAGDNRVELELVLSHYKETKDSLKLYAAQFLIENMHYHLSKGRLANQDDKFHQRITKADSIYYALVNRRRNNQIDSLEFETEFLDISLERRKKMSRSQEPELAINYKPYVDCSELSHEFLISHIDNAFRVWQESPYARGLSFEDFKEYILPYRSLAKEGFHLSGATYNNLFSKYFIRDSTMSITELVRDYNYTINHLRELNGPSKQKQEAGIYDLFSTDTHDCSDWSFFACNILRSLGVPIALEYNTSNRLFLGRHYFCSVYDVEDDTWGKFSAEHTVPGVFDWNRRAALNCYRQMYAIQQDTPYSLRSNNEYIPARLSDPCIKDVTSDLLHTTSITLPFNKNSRNNIAYLAAFTNVDNGVIPVTWGVIDKKHDSVTFKTVLPNVVYFPIYYPSKDYNMFGDPFYVEMDTIRQKSIIQNIPQVDSRVDSLTTLTLSRKFAYKIRMANIANQMIGGRFEGSNDIDFKDATLLYEITRAPEPKFDNYEVYNPGEYQYLRYIAPEAFPDANISNIEWITSIDYGYDNCSAVSRIHINSPDTIKLNNWLRLSNHLVRFSDPKQLNSDSLKLAYDGVMQTTPKRRVISYNHPEPRAITHISFSPLNAENSVMSGDSYTLCYWDKVWIEVATKRAEYEYIVFDNVPANKLYWLKNNTRGKEEGMFIMVDGEQQFLYIDLLLNNYG